MTHIRYKAMMKLKELLDAIPGNKGVMFGVTTAADNTPVPSISVVESIRPGDTRVPAMKFVRKDSIDYLLTAWTHSTVDGIDDMAYAFLVEIEKVFANIVTENRDNFGVSRNPDYMLGGAVVDFNWGAPIIHPPADRVKSLAYLYIPFTISVAYDANHPEKEL